MGGWLRKEIVRCLFVERVADPGLLRQEYMLDETVGPRGLPSRYGSDR